MKLASISGCPHLRKFCAEKDNLGNVVDEEHDDDERASGAEGAREQLDQTRVLVRESLDEARRSIWDLRAEGADAQSLPSRLARLVRETMPSIADAKLETTGTYRALAQSIEDELYQIAKEAVTNAVRHADAQSIRLRLSYALEQVLLEVVDDGRG